jgi:hypothetical protein
MHDGIFKNRLKPSSALVEALAIATHEVANRDPRLSYLNDTKTHAIKAMTDLSLLRIGATAAFAKLLLTL